MLSPTKTFHRAAREHSHHWTSSSSRTRPNTLCRHPVDADGSPSQAFLEALTIRRSIYALSPTAKISDEKIKSIVKHALLHVPGAFNAQTARVVLLLGQESQDFWTKVAEKIKSAMGEEAMGFFGPKIDEYMTGYGTCMFFDDASAWDEISGKMGHMWDSVKPLVPQFEEHSNGMHQFAVWTALSLEGLAGSLQHYNMAFIESMMKEIYNLPASWKPKAQLVFGSPTGGPRQVKTFKPVEDERLVVRKA